MFYKLMDMLRRKGRLVARLDAALEALALVEAWSDDFEAWWFEQPVDWIDGSFETCHDRVNRLTAEARGE
jgi:hypothetical protein